MYYDDDPEIRFRKLTAEQAARQQGSGSHSAPTRPLSDWKIVGMIAAVVLAVWLFSGYFFGAGWQPQRVKGPHDGKPAYVSERDQEIRARRAREQAAREKERQEQDDAWDSGVDLMWRLIK